MDNIDLPLVAIRWVHIFAAIAAGGGGLFMLVALHPASQQLDDATRGPFLAKARNAFTKVVIISIVGLLASGFYNYLAVKAPQLGDDVRGLYHGLMGAKILMAFAVFFLSSALAGRSKAFEKIRANASLWLKVNVLLVALIVLLGAVLGMIPKATGG